MKLLTTELRRSLLANRAAHAVDDRGHDPVPVVKFFNPCGAATWLATELDSDGDTLFGLADLGFGCPELGYFTLSEMEAIRLPFGLRIERDIAFTTTVPLSVWAGVSRMEGSILAAQLRLRKTGSGADSPTPAIDPDGTATPEPDLRPDPDTLPPGTPLDG